MNEEDYDLFYHALNYRTAASQHAEAAWQELIACHGRLLARAIENAEYAWIEEDQCDCGKNEAVAKAEAMLK